MPLKTSIRDALLIFTIPIFLLIACASNKSDITYKAEEQPERITFFNRYYSTKLTSFDLSDCDFTSEQIVELKHMKNLTELRLWNNRISDLTPLSGLKNLTDLSLGNNQITDLTPLSGLTNLKRLALYNNQISDISPLASLTNLTELVLWNNQIKNLKPLAGLTNLKILELDDNKISDLKPLSALTNLTDLSLNNNQIRDTAPLSKLSNLMYLSLQNNPLRGTSIINANGNISKSIKKGEIIEFGAYTWLVLDVKDNKALIITQNLHTIGLGHYNNYYTSITWENTFMRMYLNNEFYYRLSPQDRSRVQKSLLMNENNPWFHTSGGANTLDNVFILNIHEVVQYFGDSGQLHNIPDEILDRMSISDEFNSARKARYADGRPSWDEGGTYSYAWWLRSPGEEMRLAAIVRGDGSLLIYGTGISNVSLAARPAMWINLE